MEFEWREAKRRQNLKEHEVDFASVEQFEFETALIVPDDREDYGEDRYQALGFIELAFTCSYSPGVAISSASSV